MTCPFCGAAADIRCRSGPSGAQAGKARHTPGSR
ncbi:hypothetical protein [Albimonas pacifica]